MADDFTTALALRMPQVNANQNLWGGLLNESFGSELLEDAIVGIASYALSGTKTLTRVNGEEDEARQRIQHITSGTGGTVTIPSVATWYYFINRATGPVIVSNGSNNVVVPAGSSTMVVSPDGSAMLVGLTKAYVDNLAFSAALPGQTGQEKKFVTTDGTAAFFDLVSLTESVKGTLPVANGGTGLTTLSALKAALAGWTQIGNPITGTGLSTATFSGIPTSYSDLFVTISALSTDTSGNITLALSDDGTNFTSPVNLYSSSVIPTSAFYGGVLISGYRLGSGGGLSTIDLQTGARWMSTGGQAFSWRCPPVTHVRFAVSAGAFDLGTLTLYGR